MSTWPDDTSAATDDLLDGGELLDGPPSEPGLTAASVSRICPRYLLCSSALVM